jgi:hypothetical protein
VLDDFRDSGAWMDDYNQWLRNSLGPVSGPPSVTYSG